jgi:nucleoside-diphosphate-sugar epimerase
MRALLIGGSGFIGPHFSRALQGMGHDVIVFHRGTHPLENSGDSGPRELLGDRRRLADHAGELRRAAADVVIDVVLSSGRQARELMDVFRGAAARIVGLSSGDVYRACGVTFGQEDGGLEPLPLTEASALRSKPQTYPPAQIEMLKQVFGWVDDEYDKIPVERAILDEPGLPGVVLRLPMVYGPGDPLRRFYPVEKRIADGRRALLMSEAMAAWRCTKGYVENVGAAIAAAAVADRVDGQIFNVGEPDAITERQWAELVAGAMQWDGRFVTRPDDRVPPHLRAPGNTAQHWVTDTSKLRRQVGFIEPVSREEAVRRTVEWDAAHPPSGVLPYPVDYAAEDAAIDG